MITLPLPDRSLAVVPVSLLGALLIFIFLRDQPSDPESALPSRPSMTDGVGIASAGSARDASSAAMLPAAADVFDYTFVFPAQETPAADTRIVSSAIGAP